MMTLPEYKFSTSAAKTAFQLSHQTQLTLFDHLKTHPSEFEQWSKSVKTLGTASQTALITDYPWESLGPGVFVDCGGGHGAVVEEVLRDSTFVVQDLPEIVSFAEANVRSELESRCQGGSLIVEAHDLFTIQPRKADVYIFRYILHNWSNADCVSILRNTAKAAGPEARFLVIEYIPQSSGFTTAKEQSSQGVDLDDCIGMANYQPITAPPFVPHNFGANIKMHSALGVHMMGVFNASERCLEEWSEIISAAGFRITGIKALRANLSVIECQIVRSDS
ncbi:S-adenosyl-L-methionine-dependent methyltransferase [Mycena metata]|uniref:S-adenosyl-L-methionine-dependent methyltransferase n=1 Tax=Mycena metata TaxID=1033252 RepID=A0AAD7I1R2_9AGAR|nr:S-adenosyl-L-methionine-dependent methyltransferase [Mycena metata]